MNCQTFSLCQGFFIFLGYLYRILANNNYDSGNLNVDLINLSLILYNDVM